MPSRLPVVLLGTGAEYINHTAPPPKKKGGFSWMLPSFLNYLTYMIYVWGGVGVWVGMRSKHQKVSPEKRYDNVPRVFFLLSLLLSPCRSTQNSPHPKIFSTDFPRSPGRSKCVGLFETQKHAQNPKTKKKQNPPGLAIITH